MEIIEYATTTCPVCKRMAPELKKLLRAGFRIKIVNCDKKVSKCKDIKHAPTLIIKKGNKSKKIVGFTTAEDLKLEFEYL